MTRKQTLSAGALKAHRTRIEMKLAGRSGSRKDRAELQAKLAEYAKRIAAVNGGRRARA